MKFFSSIPFLAVIAVTAFYALAIVAYGLRDDDISSSSPPSIGVVFGNTVFADGRVSPRLKARLGARSEIVRIR